MKEIKLTKGYVALVDDADYDFLNQWKWHVVVSTHTNYAKRLERKKIYLPGESPFISISMHRVILGLTDKSILTDHKNGNGLDNQRTNIRICSQPENSRNTRFKPNKTSIYKGVSQKGIGNQWKAKIGTNGKVLHLGTYATEKEAAIAYNIAARNIFGEFANPNNIEEDIIPIKIKTRKIVNSSSKYFGVSYNKNDKNWQSFIKISLKTIYLGKFKHETDAALAYNEAALKYPEKKLPLNNVDNKYIEGRSFRASTSKYIGVNWYPKTNRWQARKTIDGKRKLIGYFKTEEEAILAINNIL